MCVGSAVTYMYVYIMSCAQGWMYESRGPGSKLSLKTMVWASVVKVLSGWNKPRLYSFQGSLPRLPLPAVRDTMRRVSDTPTRDTPTRHTPLTFETKRLRVAHYGLQHYEMTAH